MAKCHFKWFFPSDDQWFVNWPDQWSVINRGFTNKRISDTSLSWVEHKTLALINQEFEDGEMNAQGLIDNQGFLLRHDRIHTT